MALQKVRRPANRKAQIACTGHPATHGMNMNKKDPTMKTRVITPVVNRNTGRQSLLARLLRFMDSCGTRCVGSLAFRGHTTAIPLAVTNGLILGTIEGNFFDYQNTSASLIR